MEKLNAELIMLGRIVAFFTCLVLAFGTSLGIPSLALAGYDAGEAAEYAGKWGKPGKYNTKEYYKAALDCTNFVSQCLEKGGKKRSKSLPSYGNTNYWKPHSATWENATSFRKYWDGRAKKTVGKNVGKRGSAARQSFVASAFKNLKKGSGVIQYGSGNSDLGHSQICWKYIYDRNHLKVGLYAAQHTSNRNDISLIDYMLSSSSTYMRYYDMS